MIRGDAAVRLHARRRHAIGAAGNLAGSTVGDNGDVVFCL